MRILISICSLLVGTWAAGTGTYNPGYSGGSGYGPHGGPHGGPHSGYQSFNYRDLAQLEKMIHAVGAEKIALGKKVTMLKDQKSVLLAKIDQIQTVTIPNFMSVQDTQDSRLEDIRKQIKELHHVIVDEVAALAGEFAVAVRQESFVNGMWTNIFELVAHNNQQSAHLAKAKRLLQDEKEKLYEKLVANEETANGKITELKYNTKALGALVDTRHCYSSSVLVEVDDAETYTGKKTVPFPPDFFHGLTPTAYCAMNGFHSHINLDRKSHAQGGYGYGSYGYYSDLYQQLGLAIDCKPFDDRVEITVFDQSKGKGNSVESAYVGFKLCTFGPQASPIEHEN